MVWPVCVLEGREIVAPRVGLRAGRAHASGSVATRTTDGHLLTCCRQGSLVSPLAERAAFDRVAGVWFRTVRPEAAKVGTSSVSSPRSRGAPRYGHEPHYQHRQRDESQVDHHQPGTTAHFFSSSTSFHSARETRSQKDRASLVEVHIR